MKSQQQQQQHQQQQQPLRQDNRITQQNLKYQNSTRSLSCRYSNLNGSTFAQNPSTESTLIHNIVQKAMHHQHNAAKTPAKSRETSLGKLEIVLRLILN